jgi:hypothetical protein
MNDANGDERTELPTIRYSLLALRVLQFTTSRIAF